MIEAPFSPGDLKGFSVRTLIDLWADVAPERVFLIDPDQAITLTYGELREASAAVAALIASHGVEPGGRVAYAMANGAESALAILGSLYGGYVATAINLSAGTDTTAYVLGHSEAGLVFSQAETEGFVGNATAGLAASPPVIGFFDRLPEPSDRHPAAFPATGMPQPGSDGLLMYTSGTTGRSKGVVLTHRSLIAGGANAAEAHRLTEADRALCVLPLFHINGLCVTLMGPLVSGGSVVMPNRFSVSTFWDLIGSHTCSWFSVVPTQISYLLHAADGGDDPESPIDTVRFGRSASAPLAPQVQEAFEDRFRIPIVETMGLTETAAQILSNPLPPGRRKIGSPGVAVGNEVIIADDSQREVPRGQEGEVLVRGPNVMRHYLKDDAKTSESITANGWLRTGDLGRMDKDGYVFITGRLKEIIIKGGENIAPREIDEALYSHPDVVEAAAFSCACDDYGERIEAGVVLKQGSATTETDLLAICRRRVGDFKAPDRIHFLPELPKGPSGKIQRFRLAEMTTARS